jgi:RNA polymerase sigma-70 factor, ECF subfamily
MGGWGGSPGDPDLDRERDLHRRLLAGDPVAPSELAETYLERLVARLRPRFWWLDPHLVESAAGDSIMNLAEHPERYDPERAGLLAYLYMDAAGDLLNVYKSGQRSAGREVPLEAVELGRRARKLSREEIDDPLEQLLRAEGTDPGWFKATYAELDERERAVVDLMIDGERSTVACARVIGVEHLPRDEQEREVKRWKDRLVKRLRRRRNRGERDG